MLNVVLASDDNYACHLAVTLVSVAQHTTNATEHPSFYVLDAGISKANRARLESVAAESGAEITFISSHVPVAVNIPLKRYGAAALLRIQIAELLPKTVQRAIYLDCDTLALDDLTPLASLDLCGMPIAAVENLGHQAADRLGIPEGSYFNSGMLVLDLEQFRQRALGEQVLSFMSRNSTQLVFPDQDGLNAVLKGEWKRLPLRWNQQPATYSMHAKLRNDDSRKREFREAIANPAIVHFLGQNKPWDYMTFHPLKDFYWHYLDRTPWRGAPCRGRTFINILHKALLLEKQLKRWRRQRLGPRLADRSSRC